MRRSIFGLSSVLTIALIIGLLALGGGGVAAHPPQQATMAATMGGGMMAAGACPPGLAAAMVQSMSAMSAQPTMAATMAAGGGAAATMAATMAGTMAAATGPACLVAELKGSNEVPPADPDGVGFAAISVDPSTNTIMFDVAVSKITLPATANHIHPGAAGANGSPVIPVPKAPDASGKLTATVQNVDAALIQKILANPAGYYYNVHTTDFPNGAIRGQLEKFDPSKFPMAGGMAPTMAATPGG